MIGNYKNKPTSSMPMIELDSMTGQCLFQGRSIPEDAYDQYKGVKEWFEGYFKTPSSKLMLDFKFEYFNTGTYKVIFDLLQSIVKSKNANQIEVNWYYKKDDDDMLDSGKRFSELLDIAFNFVSYN